MTYPFRDLTSGGEAPAVPASQALRVTAAFTLQLPHCLDGECALLRPAPGLRTTPCSAVGRPAGRPTAAHAADATEQSTRTATAAAERCCTAAGSVVTDGSGTVELAVGP